MKDITIKEALNILKTISKDNFCIQQIKIKQATEKVLNELETYKHYYEELTTGQVTSAQLLKKYVSRDELEKKDKIINAMAELIEECRQNDCLESEDVDLSQIAGVEAIKQYFEQEVKDE